MHTMQMSTTDKYRRYVNTYFLKAVQPIVIERAEGATVWDESGRAYVDLFSGISVVNAGHNRPEIIEAAIAQMRKLVHCNSYIYHNKTVADFAEALVAIMPSPELRVSFFGSSGAEAIEGAMRLVLSCACGTVPASAPFFGVHCCAPAGLFVSSHS